MKPHPAFPPVGSSRGAPMGRPDILPDAPPASLHVKRVAPTDGDYDQGGAYWGDLAGRPLYAVWGHTEAGDLFALYYRAPDAGTAKADALARINCRYVSTPTHAHGPFDTYQAARAFADTLPGPYSKWST